MDEIEWFGGADPRAMLVFLHDSASERKLRLFACACCDRIGPLLTDVREELTVIERFADGAAAASELVTVRSTARNAVLLEAAAEDAAGAASRVSGACASLFAEQHGDPQHPKGLGDYMAAERGERGAQCRLLRE